MMKKVLYTLNVDDYAPEITALSFPLMKFYADKIGAEMVVIEKRAWASDIPPVLEKFQVWHLANNEYKDVDWHLFFDADTLIHPDMWDVTAVLGKDTTCSGLSSDFTPCRFKPDKYFMRDGRFIGKGNWFAVFSNWCTDYYQPPDPMTKAHIDELAGNIQLTVAEAASGVMKPSHLIDDYIVSQNIARYGLKHVLVSELGARWGQNPGPMFFHQYLPDVDQKVVLMKQTLQQWGVKLD